MEECMDGDGCLKQGILSLDHWGDTGTFNCISTPTTAKRCKSKLWALTHVAHAAVSSEWIRKEGAECGDHSGWLIECGRKRSGLCGSSLSLSLPPLLSLSFESCKTGLIQCEFMPGWPCTSATYRSKFDSIYSWSISVVYDLCCCCCGWCLYCFQVGIWFPLPQEILLHE